MATVWLAVAGSASAKTLAEPPPTVIAPGGVGTVVFGGGRVNHPGSADCTSQAGTSVKIVPSGLIDVKTPLKGFTVGAGSSLKVGVKPSARPGVIIGISWATSGGNCYSASGIAYVKVGGAAGGPNAKIGPRQYSPLEKLLKTLILDDYQCLKAYSDTCTTEQAYQLAAWYVFGGAAFRLSGNLVLKPIWAVVGPEIRALLAKYGPQIAAGSKTALAEFRDQLARLIPQAVKKLPASERTKVLNSLVPHLKSLPSVVQKDIVAQRAEAILKPNGKYIGRYDSKTGILTVDDPKQLAELYKQLKAGGEAAASGSYKDGVATRLPGGGFVGLKNKAQIPSPESPNSVGPSIDINIPGLEPKIRKIKPATHSKRR